MVDEAEAGGPAAVLKQQLKSLDALVAERVDAVLAARGWGYRLGRDGVRKQFGSGGAGLFCP